MATSSCTAVDDSMATTSSSSPVLGNRVRALTRQFDDQSGRSTPPPLPCREKPQPAARKRSLPSQAQASPAAPAPRDSCDTPPLTQAPQRSSSSQSVNETGRRRSLPAPPLPPPTATEQETSVEEGGAVVPSKPARRPRLLPKPSLKPTAKPPLPPLIEGQYSSLDSDYTSMYDAMPSPASAEVAPLRFNLNSTDVVQKTKTTTSTHSLDDYNSVIDITTSDAVDGTYEGGSERAMEDNRSEEVVVQRRSLENKSHGTTIGTISLDNSLLDFAIDLCDKNIPLKPPSVPPTSTIPATAALHDENEHERPPSQTETTVELLNAAEASILQHIDVSQPAPFIALPSEQHHTSTVNTNTARNISRPKSASLTLERVKSHLKSSSTDLLRFVPRPSASPAFLRRARSAARPKSPSAAFLNPVTDKLQSIDDDVPLPPTRTSSILPLLYPDAPPVPPHAPRCSAPPPLYATTPDSDNGFSSEEEEEELDVSATQPDSAPSSSGFGDEDVFLNEGDDVYECLVAADGPICSPQTEKPVVEPIYDTRYAFSEPIPLYQDYPDVRVRRIETFALGEQRPTQPAVNEDMAKLLRSSPLHSSTGANLSRVESQRPLWCNLPAVEASGVLDAMSDQQRGAQEAMFELITSEASYLRSLDVLIEHFMANTQLTPTAAKRASIPHYTPQSSLDEPVLITPLQRRQLFGNIIAIRDGSQKLMNDFVTILQSGPTLTGVCEAWLRHMHCDSPLADKYARYHRNSVFQQRTLSELRDPSHPACPLLTSLEHSLRAQVSDPGIRALSVHSFLILPMQTVTRYHLLLSAILQRLDADAEERETTQEAKRHALKIAARCNDEAHVVERVEEMIHLQTSLQYKPGMRRVPLVSHDRRLVKHGLMIQLILPRRFASSGSSLRAAMAATTQKRLSRRFLFLCSDILLVCKQKGETFHVLDYSQRQMVHMCPISPDNPRVPRAAFGALSPERRMALFLCTLMSNHAGRQVEFLLAAASPTDRERWLDAMSPPKPTSPDELVYAEWDCPLARVVQEYGARQSDELNLAVGDVVTVLRKRTTDGWCEGQRQTDSKRGWYPHSCIIEIPSDHTRAKNYRERLQLLQYADQLAMDQLQKCQEMEQHATSSTVSAQLNTIASRFSLVR